jgi:predicted TIM-barrel fold metal-dependent hydrolase
MIIDGHAHTAGEFFAAPDIVRTLDKLGVDKIVLSPGPINDQKKYPLPNLAPILGKHRLGYAGNRLLRIVARRVAAKIDFEKANAAVAAMARQYPDRIVQAYWVDPTDKMMIAGLEARLSEWGFKALKVHQCFHRVASDGPEMRVLARFAAEKGLPLFIHLYAHRDAVGLLRLIAAHPRTVFVIAHLLGLEVFVKADRAVLSNVYFDTSPPNLVPVWHVKQAVEHFGAGKVLLGSDVPYGKNNLKAAIDRIRDLDIPESGKRLILGENSRRLYTLS